ncbi:MAG TPA: hypothetical protein VMI33_16525 [Streptosporangiaceae bacterium]|nr:hypothetical protein [Streptosporangiaceae bacterium]
MSDPQDDRIDTWLNAEVEPLTPPPGTFERIRHRAHRRKTRRAMVSAAGVVVVIAAAAAAPGITSALLHRGSGPSGPSVAAGQSPATPRPTAASPGGAGVSAQSSRPVAAAGSSLLPGGSGNPVPQNFQPTSVTFVGPNTGAVIGQAGTPGHCATKYCTSLAGTSDYGRSWFGVSAPLTGPPDGAQGVGQLRFLTTSDGWAFGPQLWVTHTGGASWTREQTYGMRVTDLETAGDRAFALFATCQGGGAAYAAGCTGFSLYTSLAGSDQWRRVPGPSARLPAAPAGGPASASLLLTGGPSSGQGYLLAPSGELLTGPLTGAAWTVASSQAPCRPGPPGPSGQPSGALLAADSARLVLVCTSATSVAGDSQAKQVAVSSDGGASWSAAGNAPGTGIATSVAAAQTTSPAGAPGGLIVLATDAGIYVSGNGGGSWSLARGSPAGAAAGQRGFSYVGMTSQLHGVALAADPGLHEVFITTDGARTWQPYPVSAP